MISKIYIPWFGDKQNLNIALLATDLEHSLWSAGMGANIWLAVGSTYFAEAERHIYALKS